MKNEKKILRKKNKEYTNVCLYVNRESAANNSGTCSGTSSVKISDNGSYICD